MQRIESVTRRCTGSLIALETTLLAMMAVLVVAAAAAPAGTITKGPCLLRVYQERVALMWETDTEGPWGVRCAGDGAPGTYVESIALKLPRDRRDDKDASGAPYIHKVWIENLVPGRTYGYRVVGPGAGSDVYRFRTIPSRTDEVTFVVYGDSRSHPDHHRKLVELMIEKKPDFVVHTGDLVTKGNSYEQWGPQFFEPLRGLIERVPIYAAKGNHEGDGGNYERLLIPPGEENNFTFDYGPLHYLCADNVSKGVDDERLLGRIAADARASKALWTFISYHEPSLNLGGHRSDWKRAEALPAFAEAQVDFVVTGHSHLYERFRPIRPPRAGWSHVTYITTGGGGASVHGIKRTVYQAATKAVRHFCLFHIRGNTLTMDAIDERGRVIDHLEMKKRDGRLNKQYLQTAVPMNSLPRR